MIMRDEPISNRTPYLVKNTIRLIEGFRFGIFDSIAAAPIIMNESANITILPFSGPYLNKNGYTIEMMSMQAKTDPINVETSSAAILFLRLPMMKDIVKLKMDAKIVMSAVVMYLLFTTFFRPLGNVTA